MNISKPKWICSQLGAREHYAIPRALHRAGLLHSLITDAWAPPTSTFSYIAGKRAAERYHDDLMNAKIYSPNWSFLAFEATHRAVCTGWQLVMARNRWFQEQALTHLESVSAANSTTPYVFSYSYVAREQFLFAKRMGWPTVLGQIDPGLEESHIVSSLNAQHSSFSLGTHREPNSYWSAWKEECELASVIIVNSDWSRKALLSQGVPTHKLRLIPLVFERRQTGSLPARTVPTHFTKQRCLTLLFLGQVTLRKGIAELLQSMRLLDGLPIRLRIVGQVHITIPSEYLNHDMIDWVGPIPRGAAEEEYKKADVFVFPTHSDGFGLTQLEARAWHLPVITTRFCGDVVKHGVNGLIVDTVTPESIASAIVRLFNTPNELSEMSKSTIADSSLTFKGLAKELNQCVY